MLVCKRADFTSPPKSIQNYYNFSTQRRNHTLKKQKMRGGMLKVESVKLILSLYRSNSPMVVLKLNIMVVAPV